ncbi:MAG: hypothetical protein IJK99_03970 [Bacteroidales bacterium]|nr:hypothetical protein [Bacteroidales bacterium]
MSRPSSSERRGTATYHGTSSDNGRSSVRSSSRSSIEAPRSSSPSRPASNGVRGGDRPSRNSGDIGSRGRNEHSAGLSSNRADNAPRVSKSRGNGAPGTPGTIGQSGRGTVHPQNHPGHQYARPGRPGQMPPSHRPMHPAPYFHHPYHHHMMHMRPVVWVHVHPRPIFWPGFWVYCNSYWYDYHVTDVVVVNRYVRETYNVDLVSYAVSGDIMYAIVNDTDGNTYLQVFDQNDKVLAEQQISSRYIKTELDRENGGCWIFKKRDKDPMLFLYVDGELLIYEAD